MPSRKPERLLVEGLVGKLVSRPGLGLDTEVLAAVVVLMAVERLVLGKLAQLRVQSAQLVRLDVAA